MADLTPYMFGTQVRCTDGGCGQLSRVVIDPATVTVTHLVAEPSDPHQLGRLVPIDLLGTTSAEISLRCTETEFFQLSHAEKTQAPRAGEQPALNPGMLGGRRIVGRFGFTVKNPRPQGFTFDVLPAGRIALRGDDPVHALDGIAGHLTGVATDTESHQVAYLLVHTGHPLGKNDAVPASAVNRLDAGIQLDITKHDVRHLPPVNVGIRSGGHR